ncbi:MAG: SBBP repeat-containing protein [Candidatus Hodarchaeales archaeon]|jgi:hypothetical protein
MIRKEISIFLLLSLFSMFCVNGSRNSSTNLADQITFAPLIEGTGPEQLLENHKLLFETQDDFKSFELNFSSFLGGSATDWIENTLIDPSGNILLSGWTSSSDLPTINAFDDSHGGGFWDSFLTMISSNMQLVFSTFFGGSEDDRIETMLIDPSGNIFISGTTESADFPTLNAFDDSYGGEKDVFLAKFSSDGQLLFSSYFGGTDQDDIKNMVIDPFGNVLLTGSTDSDDLPSLNAFDDSYGGEKDGFISKFSSDGNLLFSSYLGGSNKDEIKNIAIDPYWNILLCGTTKSADFPVIKGFDKNSNGEKIWDGFLTKISQDGQVLFSSYFGGSEYDEIKNIAIDPLGNVLITGSTDSADFPILNAFDDSYGGGRDSFIAKFSSDGILLFSSYLGGRDIDDIKNMLLDSSGYIFLSGSTNSANFPTEKAFDDTFGGDCKTLFESEGFLVKFSPSGQLLFSTFIGGFACDSVSDMVLNSDGQILITGITESTDFPTINGFNDVLRGNSDGFLIQLNSNGQLLASTYFGGSIRDKVENVIVDLDGNIILSGFTDSADFPTLNAFDTTFEDYIYSGEFEGYVAKINLIIKDNDWDEMNDIWEEFYGLNVSVDDTEADFDNDGISNKYEYLNNLLPNVNDAEEDKDFDGLSNIQEYILGSSANRIDSDYDGIPDNYELIFGLNLTYDDSYQDKDFDKMPNLWEYLIGLNPSNGQDAMWDLDNDSLTNYFEFSIKTSPILFDTDGDKIDDGYEVKNGFNPLVPEGHLDFDGDWVINLHEYQAGTDPFNILSFPFLSFNVFYGIIIGLTIFGFAFIAAWISYYFIKLKKRVKAPSLIITFLIWIGNFDSYNEFQLAKLKGASSLKEYQLVLKYNTPNYEIAREMDEGLFIDYDQYLQAKSVGASTLEEYQLVIRYRAPDYETAYSSELGGFPSYKIYELAKKKGIVTFEDFLNDN